MLLRQFLCIQNIARGKRRCFCSMPFIVPSLCSALPLVPSNEVSLRFSSVTHDYRNRHGWTVSHAEYLFV